MITAQLIQILTIITSALVIGLVLLNQPQTGDTFGSKDSFSFVRRGLEGKIHNLTIFASFSLLVLIIVSIIIK